MATVAVAVGALLLAAGSVMMGLRETRLTCTPAACAIVKTYPSSRTEQSLAGLEVVEIHEGSGKQRGSWRVSVIDLRGTPITLHSTNQAGAEALKRELEQLLAGQRETVERVTPPTYWMLIFAPLLLLFAIYEIREAIRNRGRYVKAAKPSSSSTGGAMKRPLLMWLALSVGALVVATIANLVMTWGMADSTGVLRLECRHRCDFGGLSCLPGGVTEQRLNPGEYTVKVWNPAVAGSWEPRKVQVEIGQLTHFVCEPGG